MKRKKLISLALCLVLVLSFTLGTGCGLLPEIDITMPSAPPSSPPPTAENTTPINPGWSMPPTESQAPILPSIADVVARVKPSVVAINTQVITLDFFNRPFTQEGAGSGWIISEDGIIVTNNHVVEGAKNITVTLDDGRTFPADLNTVATDRLTDLAVLKIDAANLPAATVGDSSKLRVGDWVVAIGNALGEGISATNGIVSRQGVAIAVSQDQTLYNLIQTNAAINPGNSGGPLVNMAGEVIGINSVKLAQVEVEGVGYAISSNEAMPIIEQLVNTGYVIRPFLGVQGLLTVDQAVAAYFDLSISSGALIRGIAPGGPADKAGLRAGDVIIGLNGKEMPAAQELIHAIHSSKIGQEVEITFWRDKTKNTTYATLAKSPPPP